MLPGSVDKPQQAIIVLCAFDLTTEQIPEKWHPRRFDICGCSHQILHVLVILAGLAHMFGLFRAVDFIHTHGHICT